MVGCVLKKIIKYIWYFWYRIFKINDIFNEILYIFWNIGCVVV